jgi:hypothetical protein
MYCPTFMPFCTEHNTTKSFIEFRSQCGIGCTLLPDPASLNCLVLIDKYWSMKVLLLSTFACYTLIETKELLIFQ